MATFKDLLAQTKKQIHELSTEELKNRLEQPVKPVLVDVREPDEVEAGIVPGATAIPRGFLELRIEDRVPDRAQPIVVYCAGGTRCYCLTSTGFYTHSAFRWGWHDPCTALGACPPSLACSSLSLVLPPGSR